MMETNTCIDCGGPRWHGSVSTGRCVKCYRLNRKIKDKQIIAVLDAVNLGAETSAEVQAVIGLPIDIISAYLGTLADDGLIRRVRREARQYSSRGRKSHLYFPLNGRVASLDVGPLSAPLNSDTYVTPLIAKAENRVSGFLRADFLAGLNGRTKNGS